MYIFKRGPLIRLALLEDFVIFEALPVLKVLVDQEGQVHLMQISISILFS